MKSTASALAEIRTAGRDRAERRLLAAGAKLKSRRAAAQAAEQAHRGFAERLPEMERSLLVGHMNRAAAGHALEDLYMRIRELQDEEAKLREAHRRAEAACAEAETALREALQILQAASKRHFKASELDNRETRALRHRAAVREDAALEDQAAPAHTATAHAAQAERLP